MERREKEPEREERIYDEAIVDAYGSEEIAISWYYYVSDLIEGDFEARCIKVRSVSPLAVGEVVSVTGLADADDCETELFALVRWQGRTFGVPLEQLEGVDVSAETEQAIEDWRYWWERGYRIR